MSLNAFPMESGFEGYDDYGNPIFDRAVSSAFFRNFWSKYFTDGIFYMPDDNFKVSPKNGMELSVKLGECHIRGVTAMPDEEIEETITLDAASATDDRTDRIVIRADFENDRSVSIQVYTDWKPGDSLVRKADMWELAIADVLVKKGSSSVSAANITDLRLNEELCGVVTEPLSRANTAEFFAQLTGEFERVSEEWSVLKNSQCEDFDAHIAGFVDEYNTVRNDIDAWYSGIRADISKLQTFDFDNTASIKGVTRTVEFGADTVTEIIKISASGIKVAERITTFADESIVSVTTVFEEDGETVMRQAVSTFNPGDVLVETVV